MLSKLTPAQLEAMPREQKLALIELIEEKKRRRLSAKPVFKPHPGQLRVIISKSLEKYLLCGNGYGKTTLLVNEVHWAATGFNPITGEYSPVPAKIALVLDTPEKIEEFLTEYKKWFQLDEKKQLHKRGKPHYSEMTWDTGSVMRVFTHEVSELKPEGSEWTHLFFDEPPPRSIYQSLYRGGRVKGRPLRVFMAGTPIRAAWLRTEVWEPWKRGEAPLVECFSGNSEENAANLEAGWLERFSAKLSEKEKRIRLQGEFFDLEGLALSHLLTPRHIVEEDEQQWRKEWPCVLVLDPHPSKAHNAVLLGAADDGRRYVVAEYKEKTTGRRFARSLIDKGWLSDYRVIDIVYDSLGNADNTSGEGNLSFGYVVNQEFAKLGYRARATTFEEKSDEDFIERIREELSPDADGIPKLRFYAACVGSIDDVRTVQWYEDKQLKENKPKLDIRQKDYLACIKYALATHLTYDKPARQRTHHVVRKPYGIELPAQRAARLGENGPRAVRFFRKLGRSRPTDGDDD